MAMLIATKQKLLPAFRSLFMLLKRLLLLLVLKRQAISVDFALAATASQAQGAGTN